MIHKHYPNEIRAARRRLAFYLNNNGHPEIKSNSKITKALNIYSEKTSINIDKSVKQWHFVFLLNQYKDVNSPINKGIKLPKKVNINIEYKLYINSPEWKKFSKKIKNDRGNKCEVCGISGVILHAHHKTYERFKNELETDILVVCVNCHNKIHNK